jgi:hypothetical protein
MDYFILEQDLRIPDSAAVGGVPPSIEPLEWSSGKKLSAPAMPLRVSLMRGSGSYLGDILGGVVTLFSTRLRDAFSELGVNNIDYFPVELEIPDTGEVRTDFWLVNVLGRVQCVDRAASTIVTRPSGGEWLRAFKIDPAAAKGLPLFRLHENPALVIIDGRIRDGLRSVDVRGVRMRPTLKYDGT